MEYEGQICRAPMERGAFMLPVSVGCCYNRCKFCTLFKHLSYRILPISQVEAELHRVRDMGGTPKTVFLGDGSAFQLPYDHLVEILTRIRACFPECRRVHMDATVTSIAQKSDAQLKELADLGVKRLYLGVETGLDDVLAFMDKDHNSAEAKAQIARIQAVGIEYAAHIMTGIAGAGRGEENARATAAFLNETKPVSVTNFSLFLHTEAPLYRCVEAGTFRPADEAENLQEARLLTELLEDTVLDSFHDFVLLRIRGSLPRDRQRMLKQFDEAIAGQQGKEPVYSIVCTTCGQAEMRDLVQEGVRN